MCCCVDTINKSSQTVSFFEKPFATTETFYCWEFQRKIELLLRTILATLL